MTASTEELQEAEAVAQAPPKVIHLTTAERAALGKTARAKAPRTIHAALELASDRDPLALLQEQDATRVPELVPIRYGRMLVSPFTFYRGAAKIMAEDLGANTRSGLNAQLCGDAHLSNFGGFALARPYARLRPERLRRDASRAVRMGRQAPRRELRDRRPGPRLHGRATPRCRPRRRSLLSQGDARIRVDEQPRRLVLTAHGRGDPRQAAPGEGEEAGEGGGGGAREGPDEGQHEGLQQADDRRRRRGQDRLRPAADRADRRAGRGNDARGDRRGDPRVVPDLPALVARRSPGARRELPRRRSRAQGGRRRERRRASLDPARCSDATTRTRSSSRSRRRRRRCSSRSSARASSATTDSASSRDSA